MWITRKIEAEDGVRRRVHYLVEGDWVRGRVDEPVGEELCFQAESYGHSSTRMYISIEAARARVEYCARVEDLSEADELTARIRFKGQKKRKGEEPEFVFEPE